MARPSAKSLLMSKSHDALAYSTAEAKKFNERIKRQISEASSAHYDDGFENRKREVHVSDYVSIMEPFLGQVEGLLRLPAPDAAELAWNALFHVAEYCCVDWCDGGDLRWYGDEADCEYFHDEVDRIMVEVVLVQKRNGRDDWIRDPKRREEVRKLQEAAATPMQGPNDDVPPTEYRYPGAFQALAKS